MDNHRQTTILAMGDKSRYAQEKDGEKAMIAVFWLIDTILDLAKFCILASVILSLLTAFNIVNTYQPFVQTVGRFLYGVTEPLYRPFRRFIPSINGIDLAPLAALLAIGFLQVFIATSLAPLFY